MTDWGVVGRKLESTFLKKLFYRHCERCLHRVAKQGEAAASLVIHNQNEDSREMPQIVIASFALARRGDPYSALAESHY